MFNIQRIKKFDIKRVIFSFFIIFVFLLTPLYDNLSKKYIDNSLKEALVTYAIVRSFNAVISTLQKSSVSVGIEVDANIALGEVLDPLNDIIERFSDMITLSLWTLGAEKIVYEISKLDIFIILVVFLALLYLFYESNILKNILILLIVLRLFIPFSGIISVYVNNKLFKPQIEKYQAILQENNSKINLNTLSQVKSKIIYYTQNSGRILNAFLNLSMVYFAKFFFSLVLLPFIFIYIIKNLIKKEVL